MIFEKSMIGRAQDIIFLEQFRHAGWMQTTGIDSDQIKSIPRTNTGSVTDQFLTDDIPDLDVSELWVLKSEKVSLIFKTAALVISIILWIQPSGKILEWSHGGALATSIRKLTYFFEIF